jgi:uroporphyrinogen-III synthase
MTTLPTPGPLQGIKVLVTRPQQRAGGLCAMIEAAGGTPLAFAAIEITEPLDSRSREYAKSHIREFDIAIFISPTAVEKTLEYIGELPADILISAIGSRTGMALKSYDLNIDIVPDGHDSEALLEHSQMQSDQVTGKKIVIFRGEGGRELLGKILQSRGAEIFYAEMYHRSPPASAALLDQYLAETDVITVSSNEGLQNLYDLATNKQSLNRQILVVPGERAHALAMALGFTRIIVAENATDEASLNALEYARSEMSKKS